MRKTRVGIFFGGKSVEHRVSLQSAKNVVDALDKNRFDFTLIGIDEQGEWQVSEDSNFLIYPDDPELIALRKSHRPVAVIPGDEAHRLLDLRSGQLLDRMDVVLPILHGTLGEDGSLQGLLRMADLPFVGSAVLGSAICMDKDVSKRLLRAAGIEVAPFLSFTRTRPAMFTEVARELGLPLFIKPANMGSSVGISKVEDEASFNLAMALAFDFDHKVLVEAAIDAREIECGILGNRNPMASVCGEIIVKNGFYSYEAKYINEEASVVIPANIPTAVSEEVRRLAIQAYEVLGCTGLARVDVFLTPQGRVIVNEINTMPGFTRASMFPKLWEASGVSYSQLISILIDLAIEQHALEASLKRSI